MSERIPIYYTFGNHHHWVDMEWLWGYKVTPDSVRDMLYFCRETGAKGNVNFDGVGYEKMAAECPEALAELKEAIAKGQIEPVGCSYGQPYGLFHGGESNIRQRIYGVRAVMRLLGTRPRTFWEEEFDFFPQLPQILKGCGFENASLYFQWTWHTPEVPKEDVPVVWWEAPDGSRLLTATRNRLNLHQWPEDFQILLNEIASQPPTPEHPAPNTSPPLILQWLELIPSPDWMCRAELMIPMLKKLLADERFEVKMGTLGEYLSGIADCGLAITDSGNAESNPKSEIQNPQSSIPVRRYTMDQVWHGMSLGKNGDSAPRASHRAEACLLSVEVVASVLGLFGRPYPDWDVYPVWEYEEAWRNLLVAQHHDNHECEGLCGHVADPMYSLVAQTSHEGGRGLDLLARRVGLQDDEMLVFNRFGWQRKVRCGAAEARLVLDMAPFSYRVVKKQGVVDKGRWRKEDENAVFERGSLRIDVDLKRGQITRFSAPPFSAGYPLEGPWPRLKVIQSGVPVDGRTGPTRVDVTSEEVFVTSGDLAYWLRVPENADALDLTVSYEPTEFYDKGMNAGPRVIFEPGFDVHEARCDLPFGVDKVRPSPKGLKKYPEADWMTSPQWFETVYGGFTAQTFVDLVSDNGHGLLIAHSGSQQWFLREGRYENLISMIDPWDEHDFNPNARTHYRLTPHGPLSDSERWKLARELFGQAEWGGPMDSIEWDPDLMRTAPRICDMPESFSPLSCSPSNVVPTAFYREEEFYAGRDLEHYAGRGMGHPFVIRLVEFDGLESDVELTLPGPIAKAFKTNLMGELEVELEPVEGRSPSLVLRSETEVGDGGGDPGSRGSQNLHPPAPSPLASGVAPRGGGSFPFSWQTLRFKMRPYEIATVYADLVPGRKQFRDLDAMRKVWATVHRVEE
ncbi:MAG: hypothetical protein HZC36_09105 [Armatimonadetes bacterium]|nr:hypothetical protein [Armatimonadota bacterium]